jgi:hypothetical protein
MSTHKIFDKTEVISHGYSAGGSGGPTDYKTFDQLSDDEKETLKNVLQSLLT